MPDLTADAIERWLDTYGSEDVAHVGQRGPPEEEADVLPSVVAFGATLDAVHASAPAPLEALLLSDPAASALRTVMAHLGGPRRLRLLHWLAECRFAETHALLGRLTEPDPSGAGPFLDAWIADLHRRQVLERLFSPDRIATLLAACKAADNQEKST